MSTSFRQKGRKRASVTVTALIAASILMVVALAIIELSSFMMRNSSREMERTRARWFLEGRVHELFDSWIDGSAPFNSSRFSVVETIDGRSEECLFELESPSEGFYRLRASIFWKKSIPVQQIIEFTRYPLFREILFANQDLSMASRHRSFLSGPVLVRGSWTLTPENKDSLFYYQEAGGLGARSTGELNGRLAGFTNRLKSSYSSNEDPPEPSGNGVTPGVDTIRMKELELPDFETVWKAFNRNDAYRIDSLNLYQTRYIANPLHTEKELIAFGNSSSISFPLEGRTTYGVYLWKTSTGSRYQKAPSDDTAVVRGRGNETQAFQVTNSALRFTACQKPMTLELPDEAFVSPSEIRLSGEGWSYMSPSDRVAVLYVGEPIPANRLFPGSDFEYIPSVRTLRMKNRAFLNDFSVLVGRTDGRNTRFPLPVVSSRAAIRYLVFVGNNRAQPVQRGSEMVFSSPPAAGQEVRVVRPPVLSVLKMPPDDDTGVFIDRNEQVAVLNLNQVNIGSGIILSSLPLLIRGSANQPLVILSRQSVYLESVNPAGKGETVMIVAREGVWLYPQPGNNRPVYNHCLVYSPLNGLPVISSNTVNPPTTLFSGAVVLEGSKASSLNPSWKWSCNLIYDENVIKSMKNMPFLLFPVPFQLETLRR